MVQIPVITPLAPEPQPSLVTPQISRLITVVGVPSATIEDNRLVLGDAQSNSIRSYIPIKVLGDGCFATIWLCDWQRGTLPPNIAPPAMQANGGRPEWAGKRLVAIKRMKKRWEHGWDECQQLKELQILRALPTHPNVIPLYDAFIVPESHELYYVFEPMEGNLYHLIKTRRGRPFAGGLIACIAHQVVLGLNHIHSNGWFHRDIAPENILVTTICKYDYPRLSPLLTDERGPENDTVVIIKIADFGLARPLASQPPYTEYVAKRWYRAPEIILLGREYSAPVDLWAFGTVLAELLNLQPLFPGSDQIDQLGKIIDILGSPERQSGEANEGGGLWAEGVSQARTVGFEFPNRPPRDISTFFDSRCLTSLVDMIGGLLKWDPARRLTVRQCLEHSYFTETLPLLADVPRSLSYL